MPSTPKPSRKPDIIKQDVIQKGNEWPTPTKPPPPPPPPPKHRK